MSLLPSLLLTCSPSGKQSDSPNWQSLFDGTSLDNWAEAGFAQAGTVRLEDNAITLYPGAPFTGVVYIAGDFPSINYELSLTASREEGNDIFCGLTVPYKETHFSLILGGWGGDVTGISSIDDADASQNETTTSIDYKTKKPYRIRVRATDGEIQAWVDDRQIARVEVAERKISLRPGEIGKCRPVGICSYFTKSRIRDIRYRKMSN